MRTEQLRYLLLLEQHHSLTKIGNKLGYLIKQLILVCADWNKNWAFR